MHQKPARSTIKEIESAAGISTQMMFFVVNDKPNVSSETQKNTQDTVGKLSCQPSPLVRSLINPRSCRKVIKIIESGWQGLYVVDSKSIMLPPTLVVRKSSLYV
jgi:hypothetical protein